MTEALVRAAFADQAGWCARLGSPFTAALCRAAGSRIDRSVAVGARMLDWPGDPAPEADNLPARLCAAFHFLVRSGDAPALAACYPPAGTPADAALWAAAAPLLSARREVFERFLDNPPQTNEVGRSAVLMSGLLVLADRYRLPLRLFELGASAGLNLILERYAYDLGGLRTGEPDSSLLLAPAWQGVAPPAASVSIAARRGVDIAPLDPRLDGERLLAFVWPDQRDRMARLEAALAIASADPAPVDRADAAEWLERMLPVAPAAGGVRVVLHSIAFQYFPAATQRRIEALIERTGAGAGADTPLAWLRFEQSPGEPAAALRLRTWPGGEDRLLARAQGHGVAVEWLSAPAR